MGGVKEQQILPLTISDDKTGPKAQADLFTRNMKLLFCFVGLQISYVLWGINQEQLMTNEYKFGRFTSAAFCVFGNRFLALFISLAIVIFRRVRATKQMKEAPYYYYAPSSLSNSLSSWAQYEALKFVSFPTQVLSKSCKIIPVMLVSRIRTALFLFFLTFIHSFIHSRVCLILSSAVFLLLYDGCILFILIYHNISPFIGGYDAQQENVSIARIFGGLCNYLWSCHVYFFRKESFSIGQSP